MLFETFTFPSRRSNVLAQRGMVATSQPLAAQVGLDILQSGGNAVDAAVATAAALCVVEPCSTGIGGDASALIWWAKEGKLYGLNASGPAPAALTADVVRQLGYESFPQLGPLTVTVPGSLRGWQKALHKFGSLGLETLLRQPITYACEGYPVSQRIAQAWEKSEDKMSQHPDSLRVWLPGGRAPKPAEIFRNPEFARTLEIIATEGPDAFYAGEIAEQIVGTVRQAGGFLTAADLAGYDAEWVEPLSIEYGDDFAFYELPPNGQGLTALIALNIARGFDFGEVPYGSADYYHLLIESMKLGFADAATYIGDPRHAGIPISGLLSDSYARSRRDQIKMDASLIPHPGHPAGHGDTVYLSVADQYGNMVSWIQSLYMGFGSGLTAGSTGIQLHNRGANFNLEPGHPNEVAPGKRPYHTIIPGFITRRGQAWASFGVMGGFMQPQGHLQVGLNLVQHGMDPQTALDAPRFNWLAEKKVALESPVKERVRADLRARGHDLVPIVDNPHFGGGQIIVRDQDTGVLIGGSEPRKDGAVVGW